MINEQLDGQLRMATLDPLEGKQFQVRKRDGRVVEFDETRIYLAIEAAFSAEAGLPQDETASDEMKSDALRVTNAVVDQCIGRAAQGEVLEIETIQDVVEQQLMEDFAGVAKRYILYRENRRKSRAIRGERTVDGGQQAKMFVELPDGSREMLDAHRIRQRVNGAVRGLEDR